MGYSMSLYEKENGLVGKPGNSDLKFADPKGLWGFDSPSRHHWTRFLADLCAFSLPRGL
jgi:hypothetical protein